MTYIGLWNLLEDVTTFTLICAKFFKKSQSTFVRNEWAHKSLDSKRLFNVYNSGDASNFKLVKRGYESAYPTRFETSIVKLIIIQKVAPATTLAIAVERLSWAANLSNIFIVIFIISFKHSQARRGHTPKKILNIKLRLKMQKVSFQLFSIAGAEAISIFCNTVKYQV